MRLALNGQQLGGTRPMDEVLGLMRSLGVDAVEIWPHNLTGGATREERERYETKDVRGGADSVQRFHMTVPCVTLGFHALAVCRERGPQAGTEALRGAVDAAAAFGAPVVNCYMAGLSPEVFVAAVSPAVAYAAERGLRIALENEAHDDSGTAAGVRSLVDAVGSPSFGTLFDPCNYYQAGEEPYPYAYEVLKDRIFYVHLKGGCRYEPGWGGHRGGPLRAAADRFIGYVPLPEAGFNADGLLRALARDEYRGFVTLEPHVPRDDVRRLYEIEVPYVQARLASL